MPDEVQNGSSEPVAAPVAQAASKPYHVQFREAVKDALSKSSAKVRELVVGVLYDAEIEKRKQAVLGVLTRLDEMSRNITKLKNQGTLTFNINGEAVGTPAFTKEQVKGIKEAEEQFEKLQKALSAAFEKDEWPKLIEMSKASSSQQPSAGPTAPKV